MKIVENGPLIIIIVCFTDNVSCEDVAASPEEPNIPGKTSS